MRVAYIIFVSIGLRSLIFMCGVFLGLLLSVEYFVYFGNHQDLKKSAILSRINTETKVYYRDARTQIGSFFETNHRQYVTIDKISAHMINAIVAAEDKNFFLHDGVDPASILVAFLQGLRQGRFRRGGSSITQQAVKNILKHWEHSFQRKFFEAVAAIKLEKLYNKRQILEFYLNQFHVSGNGNGVAIAARYYFNKAVSHLDLVEAAYIAGSVKGPNRYDPFIRHKEIDKKKARRRAFHRKNYVLKRMFEEGWIGKDEFQTAYQQQVPFQRGKFRSADVHLINIIRQKLNRPKILSSLKLNHIGDLETAGLKIVTTLDAELQKSAQYAMRRNLSKIETSLSGFKAEDPEEFQSIRHLEKNQFYFGKIEAVVLDKLTPHLIVQFGEQTGVVSTESLKKYARLLARPAGRSQKPKREFKKLLKDLHVGDIIFVEVLDSKTEDHRIQLELCKYPKISGGFIDIEEGDVRAIVSGFHTQGFNRALSARRQPGSVFKPIVYFAAFQLGWTLLDSLNNDRQIFPYQDQFYYPRPDHQSLYQEVSILWAGIMSENLASVYLTAHLLDKLNFQEFKQLLAKFDLMPHKNEGVQQYFYRLSKSVGVSLDKKGIQEYQLKKVIKDIEPDLVFSGREEDLRLIKNVWFGHDYLKELVYLHTEEELLDITLSERKKRIDLLKNNFLFMEKKHSLLEKAWKEISLKIQLQDPFLVVVSPYIQTLVKDFRVLKDKNHHKRILFQPEVHMAELASTPFYRTIQQSDLSKTHPLEIEDIRALWGESFYEEEEDFQTGVYLQNIYLSRGLSVDVFLDIRRKLLEYRQEVSNHSKPYKLFHYFNHHDFRIGLGLKYLVELTKSMGVTSPLEAVLSFPLGTNVVSVAEVAKIYQTFAHGKIFQFYEDHQKNQLNFIERIEDSSGHVLFSSKKIYQTIATSHSLLQVQEVLRSVVTHGTARRAGRKLSIKIPENPAPDSKSVRVGIPAFGKTGTTDGFWTSYFAGFLPYPRSYHKDLHIENSHVFVSYVGYDDNTSMENELYKVYGGNGGLIVWTDFARHLIWIKKYREAVDPLDMNILLRKEWPLVYPKKSHLIEVDLPTGMIIKTYNVKGIPLGQQKTLDRNEYLENSVPAVIRIPTQKSRKSWGFEKDVSFFRIPQSMPFDKKTELSLP